MRKFILPSAQVGNIAQYPNIDFFEGQTAGFPNLIGRSPGPDHFYTWPPPKSDPLLSLSLDVHVRSIYLQKVSN